MDSVMLSVGLDYHSDSVRVCVLDAAGTVLANKNCANDWQQIDRLARRHGTVARASIEACCGAADLAEELMHKARWPVTMSHPGLVRRMKQSADKHDCGATPTSAPIWCGWVTCPTSGSRPRRCASCAGWCVSASSWPTDAATSS